MAGIAKEAADKKAEQIIADKPITMAENVYLEYVKEDKLFSIKKIAELEAILSKNGLLPKEDSKPNYIPAVLKLSTVSSESEEKECLLHITH
jgi:nitrate reductase assembly molybdenum cofactor insertion protein NarJ